MKTLRKLSGLFLSVLIMAVFFVSGIGTIKAAPASDLTIDRDGVMVSYIGENYKWAKFRTSDGKVAYCMDLKKSWPDRNISVTPSGEADNGVRYILENGYPYKSIYGNDDVDRFITQAAVWWYLSDTGQTDALDDDFTTNSADPYNLRPLIQNLVNEAKNAGSESEPSLTVNAGNLNMQVSEDGEYFVSQAITPSLTGSSRYKVSVSNAPEGTTVVDANGNVKSSFNAGESFTIRVPANTVSASSEISVSVTATGVTSKAYILQPADTSYQRLVALYPENTNLEANFNLNITMEKPKVCVDYVIVGDVRPNPDLTDPTPGKSCYDQGTPYNQEDELTTRQENCRFNGWYTNSDLTGKWTDGTALNQDMTLYGAWECGTTIEVPSTSANIPLIILGGGLVIIAVGVGIILYRNKKIANVK